MEAQGILNRVYDSTTDSLRVSGAGTNEKWISANELTGAGGAPTLANDNQLPQWLFGDAASADVNGSTTLPSDWNTVDIDLWVVNVVAGLLDVRWSVTAKTLVDAELKTKAATNIGVTATAPANNVIDVVPTITGLAVADNCILAVHVRRDGANAADTHVGNIGLIGVRVRRVS